MYRAHKVTYTDILRPRHKLTYMYELHKLTFFDIVIPLSLGKEASEDISTRSEGVMGYIVGAG